MPALETLQDRFNGRCYVRAAFDDISVLVLDPEQSPVSGVLSDLALDVRKLGMEVRLGNCALYNKHRDAS